MSRYVVIGGGVSGLAAARLLAGGKAVSDGAGPCSGPGSALQAAGAVVLLEASDRLGGKVLTGTVAGGDVELGPDQFLRRDPSAERLSRHLGLGDDLVAPAATSAAVIARGEPRRLPAGLALGVPTNLEALAESGIVSHDAVEFARGDAERPGPVLTGDDLGLGDDRRGGGPGTPARERSAGALLRPRLGDEVVDRLVDPLIGGINAGSIDRLSLGTVAPQIARALVGHRDVIAPLAQLVPPTPAPGDPAATPAPSPFYGLAGGLGQLVARLETEVRQLGCDIRLSCAVGGVRRATSGPGYVIETSEGDLAADGVVVAVPGPAAGGMLRQLAPEAASFLSSIRYGSVAVVTLLLDAPLPERLAGLSGVLVPRVEGTLTTAVTLLEEKWPWMARPGRDRTLVRVSAGRHLDDRIAALDDQRLCAALATELDEIVGLPGAVTDCSVQRWTESFPQYEPGFRAGLDAARRALDEHPGIALAGAVLGGIGIPACITSGEGAAAGVRSTVVAA